MNFTQFLKINSEKFPLKPAIGFKKNDEWQERSFTELKNIVFKTANALKEAGVKENDKVAIFSENAAEWIYFDLAIMTLGAITVPIYATNHKDQVEYIISDSESKIILVGNQEQYDLSYEILLRNSFLKQIIVSKKSVLINKDRTQYFEDFIEQASENFEIAKKSVDDLATLIYTSGTTGIPKGVMLSHGNFIKAVDAHFHFFKFKNFENEHSLAFLPLTHIFERSWTLLCLAGGAKVSFLENPKHIVHALSEVKPTMMCAVPRFYQKIYAGVKEMVNEGSAFKKKIFNWAMEVGLQVSELKRNEKQVPSFLKLKNAVATALVFKKIREKMGGKLWFMPCGGASISSEVTQFFDSMHIHITVGYGLTETTATLTAFPLTKYAHGTAGICLPGTAIKIGENDEILAKGPGIMKGYYKKPEETDSVFTPDGWFRTGDAGKFDAFGNLVITDRIKDLMKTSNGKYVAPQPIENMLSNNNYIQQVMLVAEGRPYVTALIVPNFEYLQEQLKKMNIPFTTWNEILNVQKIKDLYHRKIEEFQQEVSVLEKVKKFVLIPAEFEISSGEITPTLKIKRNIVLQKYQDVIEKMYMH